MVELKREELLKIADSTALKLYDNEIDELASKIEILLKYIEELDEISYTGEEKDTRCSNRFREDVAKPSDSSQILKQAPKEKNNFFVVPQILKQ